MTTDAADRTTAAGRVEPANGTAAADDAAGTAPVDARRVRQVVEAVPDPELPPVTIGMLGMVHHLDVHADGRVEVELLPTYSGCPATEMIERDVRQAVAEVPVVREVAVRFRFDPAWTPDRIDEAGHDALRSYGIAPPGGPIPEAVQPSDPSRALPLAIEPTTATAVPCPYCGSGDTVQDSAFGPTPCRDLRYCASCQQPFEAFRST